MIQISIKTLFFYINGLSILIYWTIVLDISTYEDFDSNQTQILSDKFFLVLSVVKGVGSPQNQKQSNSSYFRSGYESQWWQG